MPYNRESKEVTWETCTLRAWLNGEFLNKAFSTEEQAMLKKVTVTAEKHPDFPTDPGRDTQDKVWILSYSEWQEFHLGKYATCYATDYAVSRGVCNANGHMGYGCNWWLRNPGSTKMKAYYVAWEFNRNFPDFHVSYEEFAVRPVIVIQFSNP